MAAAKKSIADEAHDETVVLAKEKRTRDAQSEQTDLVTLSTGIVIRCKPVSRLIFSEMMARMPEPEPPMIFLKDKERTEANPNDPDYAEERKQWGEKLGLAGMNAMLLFGTEIASVPDGMDRPEDTRWLDRMRLIGIATEADSEDGRYLLWIRFYACGGDLDLLSLQRGVVRVSGNISEEDVDAAVRTFRNREERRTDRKPGVARSSKNGNTGAGSRRRSRS